MTAVSHSRREPIGAAYQRLRRLGLDDAQAANLTALTYGIRICPQPWTVRELAHLLFLRDGRRNGRWSDASDRRALDPLARLPLRPGRDQEGG